MAIYLVNILIVILVSPICKCKFRFGNIRSIEGKKVYGVIVCCLFSFIMACRDLSVGADTETYSRIYTFIANSSSFTDAIKNAPLTAPAYVVICRILSYISKDPRIMIAASSLIINIGLMNLINKVSVNAPVSYLAWIGLTLFYFSMNGTRQSMAMIISLHALVMLADNLKNKKAWILFAFAVLIHATALAYIVAVAGIVLAERINDKKKLFFASAAVSLIIAFSYGFGVKLVLLFVPRYSMYTSGEDRYSIFKGTAGGRVIVLYLLLLAFVTLWTFQTRAESNNQKSFTKKMLPALVIGAILGIVNSNNHQINRLVRYYFGIYALLIPNALSDYRHNNRLILTAGIIGALLTYSILCLLENKEGVVPYRFFW